MPYPIVIESAHMPPPLHAMFLNLTRGKRVKTQRYRTWIAAAGWDCNGKGRCSGPFKLVVTYSTEKRRSNADLDNRIKPTLDLLTTQGLIDDDKHCEAIHASWGICREGIAFRAEIWPVRS